MSVFVFYIAHLCLATVSLSIQMSKGDGNARVTMKFPQKLSHEPTEMKTIHWQYIQVTHFS